MRDLSRIRPKCIAHQTPKEKRQGNQPQWQCGKPICDEKLVGGEWAKCIQEKYTKGKLFSHLKVAFNMIKILLSSLTQYILANEYARELGKTQPPQRGCHRCNGRKKYYWHPKPHRNKRNDSPRSRDKKRYKIEGKNTEKK